MIATTLVLGSVYYLVERNELEVKNTAILEDDTSNFVSEESEEVQADEFTEELDLNENTEEEDIEEFVYKNGETLIVSQIEAPRCVNCEDIVLTTEVDLTEDSLGDEITGRLYLRAYDKGKIKSDMRIGEYQITRNFLPFSGDGGTPYVEDTDEILTITEDKFDNTSEPWTFGMNFHYEFMESVPGWGVPGYVMVVKNNNKQSSYDGRHVNFAYNGGLIEFGFPQ